MSVCSSDDSNHYYTPSSVPPTFRSPMDSPATSVRLIRNEQREIRSAPPSLSGWERVSLAGGSRSLDYELKLPFSESFSEILSLSELAVDSIQEEPLLCRKQTPSSTIRVSRHSNQSKESLDDKNAGIDWEDEDVDGVMVLSREQSHSLKLKSLSSHSSLTSVPNLLPPNDHTKQALSHTNSFYILTELQPLFPPSGIGNNTNLCIHVPTCVVYACKFVRPTNGKVSAEQIALERIAAQNGKNASPEGGISFLQRLRWLMDDEGGLALGEDVYMILDYYPNGSLKNYVDHVGKLDASLAQFFAAEIALALDTLHNLGITHGGLSPNCVMLGKDGHAVICNFTRAQVDGMHYDYTPPRTDTCECGVTCSCECRVQEEFQCSYLAPEILLGWKHDTAADSWGFGMILYFMLFGRNPFKGTERELASPVYHDSPLLTSLSTDDIKLVHPATRDLLIKCLHRNPSLRSSIQLIMGHMYFSRIDWGKMRRKLLPVPHFRKLGLKFARKTHFSTCTSPSSSSSKPRSLNSLLPDGHQRPHPELKGSRPMLTIDTDIHRKSRDHAQNSADVGRRASTVHARNAAGNVNASTTGEDTFQRPSTPEIVASYIVAQSQGQPVPEIFSPPPSHDKPQSDAPLTIDDEELEGDQERFSDIAHYIDGRLDEVRPRSHDSEDEMELNNIVAQYAGILDENDSRSSSDQRSTLPCTPEARERIPHERFWEMLDEEEAVHSSRTTSSHLHFPPLQRKPRKLQKPRSSAVFTSQQTQFLRSPSSRGTSSGLRRCKSTSALRLEYSEPIEGLPDGIKQMGMGIGYTPPDVQASKTLALGCTTIFRGGLQKIGVRLGGAQSTDIESWIMPENEPPASTALSQAQHRRSVVTNPTSTESGHGDACSSSGTASQGAPTGFAKVF